MKSLVILLHGVGSRGADLTPLGQSLRASLPDAVFAAPDAPHLFDQGGPGRQWFSVSGVTAANRSARIVDARPTFDETLDRVLEENDFGGALDRVALVGFSQGSIMALDALASGRWPVKAIVAFVGRLASPDPLTPCLSTRTFLIHGEADPVISAAETLSAEARLRELQLNVQSHILANLGHAISPDGADLASAFLKDALDG